MYNIKAMKREDIVVPQKKKQHYIPKTLLKRFSINKKCFIYNLKSNEVIDNAVSYEDQCYANYMYGSDLKIENELAEIESGFSAILDFVIINNSLPVEEERIKKLSRYIILQWLRTESAVDRFQIIAKDTMCSFLPSVLSYYKIDQENFDVDQYVGEYIATTFPRQQVAVHNVECSLSSDLNISDLKLCILNNATYAFRFKIIFDLIKAAAIKIHIKNITDIPCFFFNYFWLTVFAFSISEQIISKLKRPRLHTLLNTPTHVCADIFAFSLRKNAIQTDCHFILSF